MNKTFKKIAASIMAVASLVVSITSFGASAVEPRVGGSKTFYVNNKQATAYIDRASTSAYATTTRVNTAIPYLYVSITATKSTSGSDIDYSSVINNNKVTSQVWASSGYTYTKGYSLHEGRADSVTSSTSMTA